MIKRILKSFVPEKIIEMWRRRQTKKLVAQWENGKQEGPLPHLIKQETISDYQQKHKYAYLIETGTYLGDMVEAQKKRFKNVISIELDSELARKAVQRFEYDKNVKIVQGDSGKVLSQVLADINEPAIFWLDGHYSAGITAKGDKDCPVFEELDAIFNAGSFNHVLLIDDARYFNGEGDYPTIDNLTQYVKNKNEKYRVEVKHDIIRYEI